jgi:2-keto-3-deoxy-L-rhamnonate aldolase RhmA
VNPLRRRLEGGQIALGTWLSLGSPNVAEVLAHAGFDWLLIDGQHSPIGPAETFDLSRLVAAAGVSPVVRVASADAALINHALDAGAHGVMVPMVDSSEAAARVVAVSMYPPKGERSIGGYRAQYSFGASRADYLASGGEPLVVIQIEDRRAVDRIDEILAVGGLDVCFVGPQDLAASLGLPPILDSAEPRYVDALARIVHSAQRHNVGLGILTATIEAAERHVDQGFRLIAVSTDARLLGESARAMTTRAGSKLESTGRS